MKPQKKKIHDSKIKKEEVKIAPSAPAQVSINITGIPSNKWMIYGIIALFTFALYFNTLNHDYALDDAIVITQNQFTKKGFDGIKEILENDGFTGFFGVKKNLVAGGRYRPLSLITFAIEWQFSPNNPALSHFINILLYALTGILLYIVLCRLLIKYETKHWYFSLPFLTTLLFIAHPIHTEVIANIKGRDEIMTFMGALAALLFTLRYLDSNKILYLIFSAICFFLGLMSKENAITFLAVIPIAVYIFTDYKIGKNLKSLFPLIFATIIFLIIRQKVLGTFSVEVAKELMNNPFLYMTGSEKFATIFYTLGVYIKLIIFPHPLTFDYYPYHIPKMSWDDISPVIAAVAYLLLGVYALIGLKRKSIVAFGVILFLSTISIVSNIFFPVGTFMNERFVYISSLGFCLILSYYLVSRVSKFLPGNVSAGVLGFMIIAILGLYSFKTISRNPVWKDDLTLFTHDVTVSENSAKSNCSAGGKLIETATKPGNEANRDAFLKKALVYLRKSVAIHPTYTDALLLLGNAHYEYNKDYDSTVIAYKKILKQNPNYERVFTNMDIILARYDNFEHKFRIWNDLYKINQNRFEVNYGLGNLYGRYKNNLDSSIFFLEKAVKIKASSATAFRDLGVAYGMKKQFEKSIENFEKAMQLDPNDDQVYYNLGVTYGYLNNKEKADLYISKAMEVKAKREKKN